MSTIPDLARPPMAPTTPGARRFRLPAGSIPLIVVGFLTISPLIAMIYGGLSPKLLDTDQSYDFDTFISVYTDPTVWKSLGGTVATALAVAVLSLVLGGIFAWLIARTNIVSKRTLELFIIAPLFTSPFVAAISWFAVGAPESGLFNVILGNILGTQVSAINLTSLGGIVFVLVLHYAPYAYLFISSGMRNMDSSLEEASYVNGSGIIKTLRRVTIPMILPSIASAFLFIVILAAGMFSVPAVLGRDLGFIPLPVLMFRAASGFIPDYPRAAAIGSVLFLISLVFFYIYRMAVKREKKFVTVSGRGVGARVVDLGKGRYVAAALIVLYGIVCVVVPNLALLFSAITPFAQRDLSEVVFTGDNIVNVMSSPQVLTALTNTLIVSAITAALCVLISLASAFSARHVGPRIGAALDYLNSLPLAIPGIVLGAGLIWIYVRTPLYATLALLIIGFITEFLPHAFRLIRNGALQLDRSLEEASFVNGAGRIKTAWKVTAPLIRQPIFSAIILIIIFTMREVNVAILIYSPGTRVISVITWDYIENGALPEAAVLGLPQTLMLVAVLIIGRLVFKVNASSTYV